MFLLLPLLFLPGVFMLVLGLRGTLVATDPHCRKCRFNLRGRAEGSTRCPECGAELSGAGAIRATVRRRRRALAWAGGALTFVPLLLIAVVAVNALREYDWTPWKPATWLLADAETGSGADYAVAVRELTRRAGDPATPQAKVDFVVDRALAHQADRSAKWDRAWGEMIAAAGTANHLSADRAHRYLEQAVAATLRVRPKVRRGQYVSVWLNYGPDRLASGARLRGSWEVTPLTMGSVVVAKNTFTGYRQEQELGSGGTNGYGAGARFDEKTLAPLPDGKHQITGTFRQTLRQTEPFAAGPVTATVPLSVPVELFPTGATVDEFTADPQQAPAQRAAVKAARVLHDAEGHLEVRVKTGSLPVALAVKAVLTQGAKQEQIDTLLVGAGQKPRWTATRDWRKHEMTGTVDVHLRPDQSASDYQETLGTYWGDEIVIPNVTIDAPYDVPFVTDESLRPAVEKALGVEAITRGSSPAPKDRLSVSWNARGAPVKLAYQVYLARDGRELRVGDPYPCIVPKGENYGWARNSDDIDPAGQADECEVIFRPDSNWESQSSDLDPPWGGEVVLHHVKITTSVPPPPPAATKPAATKP